MRFVPTSLGENTADSFEWFLDGSDVGLDRYSENIDAISFDIYNNLVISTVGNFETDRISAQHHDLVVFNASSLGTDSAGYWHIYLDGSDVGLTKGREGVWGSSIHPLTGEIYLTSYGNFSVDEVTGSSTDIFVCAPYSIGSYSSCSFNQFWAGESHGLSGQIIDGISIRNK